MMIKYGFRRICMEMSQTKAQTERWARRRGGPDEELDKKLGREWNRVGLGLGSGWDRGWAGAGLMLVCQFRDRFWNTSAPYNANYSHHAMRCRTLQSAARSDWMSLWNIADVFKFAFAIYDFPVRRAPCIIQIKTSKPSLALLTCKRHIRSNDLS